MVGKGGWVARPQPEDGTVRIARELYTAIVMAPFSKRELKIVLAWIRLGYGWQRKEVAVSKAFLSRYTGVPLTKVNVTLTTLQDKNVLHNSGGKIRLNKDYEQWEFGDTRFPKWEVIEVDRLTKREPKVPKTGSRGSQNGKLRFPKWELRKLRKPLSQGIPAPYAIYDIERKEKLPSYCPVHLTTAFLDRLAEKLSGPQKHMVTLLRRAPDSQRQREAVYVYICDCLKKKGGK